MRDLAVAECDYVAGGDTTEEFVVNGSTYQAFEFWPTYTSYTANYDNDYIYWLLYNQCYPPPTPPIASIDGKTVALEGYDEGADIGIKDGVDLSLIDPHIAGAFSQIADAWANNANNVKPVITSGDEGYRGDGVHSYDSKHYSGDAVDVRGNNLTHEQGVAIAAELTTTLGAGYFVQFEEFTNSSNNHIHIQWNGA